MARQPFPKDAKVEFDAPTAPARQPIPEGAKVEFDDAPAKLTPEQEAYFARLRGNTYDSSGAVNKGGREQEARHKQIEQNITLGFGDEIRGKVAGVLAPAGQAEQAEADAVKADREQIAANDKEFPITTLATAALSPTPLGPLVGLGRGSAVASKAVKTARALLPAAEAGLYGAGTSDGGALAGAAIPTAIAAATPLLGKLAKVAAGERPVQKIVDGLDKAASSGALLAGGAGVAAAYQDPENAVRNTLIGFGAGVAAKGGAKVAGKLGAGSYSAGQKAARAGEKTVEAAARVAAKATHEEPALSTIPDDKLAQELRKSVEAKDGRATEIKQEIARRRRARN